MCLYLSFGMQAQQEITDFRNLQSNNPIPKSLVNLYNIDQQKEVNNPNLVDANYLLKVLIDEGSVRFNDPLTSRINSLKPLLSEELQEVQFLTVQSNVPAVFHNNDDLVFLTTGLIARLSSEAELIFFMAKGKELAEQDPVPVNNYDFGINTGFIESFYQELHTDKIISECLLNNNESRHKSANKEAMDLLIELNLDPMAAITSIQKLQTGKYAIENSLISAEDMEFTGINFDQADLEENYKEIQLTKGSISSRTFHPGLSNQIKQLESRVREENKTGKFHLRAQSQFETIKTLARFDLINHELNIGNIKRAIYYSLLCKRNHPDNYFINFSLVRGFYALSAFKNADKWSKIKNKDRKIKGHFSQFSYFINKLSKEEINLLAIQLTSNICSKFPENKALKQYQRDIQSDIAKFTSLSLADLIQKEEIESLVEKLDQVDEQDLSRAERIRAKQRLRIKEEALKNEQANKKDQASYLRLAYKSSIDSTKLSKFSQYLNGGSDFYYENNDEVITPELKNGTYINPKEDYGKISLISANYYQVQAKTKQIQSLKTSEKANLINEYIKSDCEIFETILLNSFEEGSVELYNQKAELLRFITEINVYGRDIRNNLSNQDIINNIMEDHNMETIATLNIINLTNSKISRVYLDTYTDLILIFIPPFFIKTVENKFFQKSNMGVSCIVYSLDDKTFIQEYFTEKNQKPRKIFLQSELFNLQSTFSNN